MDSLNKQFRKLRKLRGVTQEGLVEKSGVSRSTICNFELGKRNICLSSLAHMVRILNGNIKIRGNE